jgi:hypothetical protein
MMVMMMMMMMMVVVVVVVIFNWNSQNLVAVELCTPLYSS